MGAAAAARYIEPARQCGGCRTPSQLKRRALGLIPRYSMNTLLFIDTNILLDFYRVRSRDAGLSTLRHLDQNHERLITTGQVEMEFKKNRQAVILESLQGVKNPDAGGFALPSLLAQSKQSRALSKNRKRVEQLAKALKQRLGKALHESKYP